MADILWYNFPAFRWYILIFLIFGFTVVGGRVVIWLRNPWSRLIRREDASLEEQEDEYCNESNRYRHF